METRLKEILNAIPYGKENAISRTELTLRLNIEDRMLRKAIETLRKRGEIILSSSHSKGYWRSDDVNEIERYLNECDSRCRKTAMTNHKMRCRLYEMTNQKFITVREHIRRIG